VTALGVRKRDERDEPPRLRGIVVLDCRLEVLAERSRLPKLPPQPAEEAHRRLVGHAREAIARRSHPRDRDNESVKEILPEIEAWKKEGEKVVVATVVATRRSAPRPIGTSLAISESGKMCGSVSGGCVESDVFENAQEVFRTGEPKLLSYGIEDDLAWSVGLPCGGEIDVFVEPLE
jgi:XdhC and CoxI family